MVKRVVHRDEAKRNQRRSSCYGQRKLPRKIHLKSPLGNLLEALNGPSLYTRPSVLYLPQILPPDRQIDSRKDSWAITTHYTPNLGVRASWRRQSPHPCHASGGRERSHTHTSTHRLSSFQKNVLAETAAGKSGASSTFSVFRGGIADLDKPLANFFSVPNRAGG